MDLQPNDAWQWSNFTWSNASLPDGTCVGWYIIYEDTSGNANQTGTMDFMIVVPDTAPPEISNVTVTPVDQYVGGFVNVSCTVADATAVDDVRCLLRFPDQSTQNLSMTPARGTYFVNQTYLQVGTYTFAIWAVDTEGNGNTSASFNFSIVTHPPYVPSDPRPPDGATNVSLSPALSWTGGDPDAGDTVTYDVYFGTCDSPPKVQSNGTAPSYGPGTLSPATTYFWQVIAWDDHHAAAGGPVWSFATVAATTVNHTFVLRAGWNLITIPVNNTYTAKSLLQDISGCTVVYGYDVQTGTARIATAASPPETDFPIEDGVGYFVAVTADTIFAVNGTEITAVSIPLYPGWNMLGWYHDYLTTAKSILANITTCSVVYGYDAETSTAKIVTPASPPETDFPVTRGTGLFVAVTVPSVWHGEG
jgi:hypothetical protein